MITKGIVENVEASYIETYLNTIGLKRSEEEREVPIDTWVNNLIDEHNIDIDSFEEFLFEELFMGKRKLMRIYRLDSIKKIIYLEDWQEVMLRKYGISSFDFNAILDTHVNINEQRKVAAIHHEENEKGELVRLQILFVCFVQVNDENGHRDSRAYIPVDIDFVKKIMILKAWNRHGVVEKYRADTLTEHIKRILSLTFNVKTKNFMIRHKQVLYSMSKGLVEHVYNNIPAFKQIAELQNDIDEFEQLVFSKLPIINVRDTEEGKKDIPHGIMEFSDEIKKALERLAISDYFFDRNYDEIWNMGIDAIIARIKFNDKENILTSLSGEDSDKPIFCTKTYMYLKKSMEDSKLVEKLWVVKSRSKGTLNIRYDASEDEYLGILIRSGIRYTEDDMHAIMEIYRDYESTTVKTIASSYKRCVG